MGKDWQKTVNLREKMAKERAVLLGKGKKAVPDLKKSQKPLVKARSRFEKQARQAQAIDQVYNGQDEEIEPKQDDDLRTITRPVVRQVNEGVVKRVVIVMAIIIIGLSVYALFFHSQSGKDSSSKVAGISEEWYAIKLINDEIYHGQISNIAADPVVVNNVYYDYDQLKSADNQPKEGNNLRLIKRGQEKHGPAGTMDIVRTQIIYMEPLKNDSKVLRAILDYEN